MRHDREELPRWVSAALIIFGFPVMVASSFGFCRLIGIEGVIGWDQTLFVLLPVCIYGGIAGRAWTLALPLIWSGILVIVYTSFVHNPSSDWSLLYWFVFFVFVPLMTFAIGMGLVIGAIIRAGGERQGRL